MFKDFQIKEFIINNKHLCIFISTILLSFLIFSPSYYNSNYFWDDDRFVFMNPELNQAPNWYIFWNFKSVFFKSWPLGYSFFWFLVKYNPLNTIVFYKSLNIFFHGVNAFLVYKLGRVFKFKYSYILSLIFLVHSLNVETVSWVFQLLTILSFGFFITSLIFLVKFLEGRSFAYWFASITFFTFSLWTKSIALLAPFYFLILFWRYRKKWSAYFTLIPFFIISFYVGIFNILGNQTKTPSTALIHQSSESKASSFITKTIFLFSDIIDNPDAHIKENADKAYFDFTYKKPSTQFLYSPSKIFNQGIWHYFSKILIPTNLNFIYPDLHYHFTLILLALVFVILGPVFIFIKTQERTWPTLPFLAFALLGPYLGITNVAFFYWSNVSDRYTYFSLLTLIISLGLVTNFFKARFIKHLLIVYCFLMALYSLNYGTKFNHPYRLYEDIIVYKPHPAVYSLLFEEYYIMLDQKNAERILNEGLKLFPNELQLMEDSIRMNNLNNFYKNN